MRVLRFPAVTALGVATVVGCAAIVPIADISEPEYALASARSVATAELELGREIYTTRCTRCHRARPVHDYSAARWSELLPRMAELTRLDEREAAAVRAFVSVRVDAGVGASANP